MEPPFVCRVRQWMLFGEIYVRFGRNVHIAREVIQGVESRIRWLGDTWETEYRVVIMLRPHVDAFNQVILI